MKIVFQIATAISPTATIMSAEPMVYFAIRSSCWTQLTDQEGFAVLLIDYTDAKLTQLATWQRTRISYAILEAFKQVHVSRVIAFYNAAFPPNMLLSGKEIESTMLRIEKCLFLNFWCASTTKEQPMAYPIQRILKSVPCSFMGCVYLHLRVCTLHIRQGRNHP